MQSLQSYSQIFQSDHSLHNLKSYHKQSKNQFKQLSHEQISTYFSTNVENHIYFQKISQLQKKLKYPKHHTYSFPIQLLQIKIILGKDHLKIMMREQAGQKQFDQGWRIDKQKLINNQYSIYVRCLNCKATIYYRQNSDKSWKLIKYRNHHIHSTYNQSTFRSLTKTAISENIHLTNNQLYKKINESYPISMRSLLQKKNKFLKDSNFVQLKQLFTFLGYQYRHDSTYLDKQSYPQTLLIVSKQQKSAYLKYGQTLSFNIYYDCIKQPTCTQKKLALGIISGFDTNKRFIIFGYAICIFETKDNFKTIFDWFFDIIGANMTSAIITDRQQILVTALIQLKQQNNYKYHLCYDNWHFLKSLINSVKTDKNKQFINLLFYKLTICLRQSDLQLGQILLKDINQLMLKQDLKKQYDLLELKLNQLCLWKMPQQFIGLGHHSDEDLNNLIDIDISLSNLYQLIEKLDKYSKKRYLDCQIKKQIQRFTFEIFHDDCNIKQIRQKFQKKVFGCFIFNYNRSQFFKLKSIQTQKKQYIIHQIINSFQYMIVDWQCSCQATDKTGVPCQHLIFLKRQLYPNQSYLKFFNERWLMNQKKREKSTLKLGRRKRSRRNPF